MNIKYHFDIVQGTPEWHDIRRGMLTSSAIKTLITPTGKLADNDKVRAHVYQVASERITGRTDHGYQSDDMMRGHFEEVRARDLYSDTRTQVKVVECGFITREIDGITIGYSPDGLVSDNGLIEIKSAKTRIQVERIAWGRVPNDFVAQIQTGLFVTQRDYIDFIMFGNGMPMKVVRVLPDAEYHSLIQKAAIQFEAQVAKVINAYTTNSEGCPIADYIEPITNEEIIID